MGLTAKALANPLLRRAVRRVRRRWFLPHWWPGRRPLHLLLTVAAAAAVGGACLFYGWLMEGYLARRMSGSLLVAAIVLLGFGLPWLAPAFTAPAIAGERVSGALDLLRVTSLGEGGIVLGKVMEGLVRLWPVVLALLALTPVQAGWDIWSEFALPAFVAVRAGDTGSAAWLSWAAGGALLPWSHLAVNGALGLLASACLRSSGAAVAASYVLLFVWRAVLWLCVLFGLETIIASEELVRRLAGVILLAEVAFEAAASVLLVWGTVWRLGRE